MDSVIRYNQLRKGLHCVLASEVRHELRGRLPHVYPQKGVLLQAPVWPNHRHRARVTSGVTASSSICNQRSPVLFSAGGGEGDGGRGVLLLVRSAEQSMWRGGTASAEQNSCRWDKKYKRGGLERQMSEVKVKVSWFDARRSSDIKRHPVWSWNILWSNWSK